MRNDPLCGGTRLQKLIPVVERLASQLQEPLDFGGPEREEVVPILPLRVAWGRRGDGSHCDVNHSRCQHS